MRRRQWWVQMRDGGQSRSVAGAAIGLTGAVSGVLGCGFRRPDQDSDPTTGRARSWAPTFLGKVLNGQGFATEFIPADSQVVYTSMCEGDIDVVHEVWQGAFGVAFEAVVAEGCVIDAATHDAKTREEWWYPSYVEEQCPGLPDWQALNACAENVRDGRDGPEGSLPRRAGRLVEARRRACRRPRHGLRGGERRLGCGDLGRARIGVRSQGAHRALQLDAQLHRGDLRRQVRRVPGVRRGLQGRSGLGSQSRHDLRLRQSRRTAISRSASGTACRRSGRRSMASSRR